MSIGAHCIRTKALAICHIVNANLLVLTYAMRADRHSGVISINGAAAHKASPGDIIIIASYAIYNEIELEKFKPQLVYVDSSNRMQSQRNAIPAQAA